METTEYIHRTAQQLLERLDEARALIERIEDQPVRTPQKRTSVIREMVAANYPPDEAWRACSEMIGLRNQIKRLISDARGETEVLTGIADDVIGKTGRLV